MFQKYFFQCLMALAVVAISSTAFADVIHDESVDGDLSDDSQNPTAFVLAEGTCTFIGSTEFNPLDPDFFTVTIPNGTILEQIILTIYDTTEDQSFFAVSQGTTISTAGSDFIGSAVIGNNVGAQQGDDVLDDLGNASFGGTGFTPPLPSDTYTFWFQENAADTNYQFDFIVSQAIPEPSTAMLILFGATGFLARRKK